jgi:lysophospholipase L1-like esterase
MRVRLFAFGVALLASTLTVLPAAASAPQFNPPKSFYLSLGDSRAFGLQLGKLNAELAAKNYDPATFNTGYTDVFGRDLAGLRPQNTTVNLGCPGETTRTFIQGGCRFKVNRHLALHVDYAGPQEAAALAFLAAHPGQVSPITIALGFNDARFDPNPSLDQTEANLDRILGDLREASPSSEIIVLKYDNPNAVLDPTTDATVIALNARITAAATAHRARLADMFTPFNRTGDETVTLCLLSLICTALQDNHPSDAGYAVMARQFWNASGYSRLTD